MRLRNCSSLIARAGLVIKDERDLSGDLVIGKYQIKLNDMLKMMEKGQEWFQLSGAKTGRVKMMLDWKPVAVRGFAGSGYVNPIGVVRLHFQKATDLRNLETMGKSDPYVRVLLSGIMKGRTVTYKNNLNPEWDEIIYVPVHSAREKLTLEVMDEETLGKDRTLGELELTLSDYIREDETGEYEVDDEKQLMTSGLKMRGRGSIKGFLQYTVAFYPALNVVDPEEEAEEVEDETAVSDGRPSTALSRRSDSKRQSIDSRKSIDTTPRKSLEAAGRTSTDIKINGRASVDSKRPRRLTNGTEAEASSVVSAAKEIPKVNIGVEDLQKYGEFTESLGNYGGCDLTDDDYREWPHCFQANRWSFRAFQCAIGSPPG
jgi:Ca2+-dependent lipid-binding protein